LPKNKPKGQKREVMEMMIPQNRIVEEIKLNAYLRERTIYINEQIDEDVEFLVNRMFEKIVVNDDKDNIPMENREPIKLKISCPGGSAYSTLSIISTIEALKERGYKIYGYSYGACMSGAFKIFISCSKRFAQKYTRFMFHQVQSFEFGHISLESSKRTVKDLEELWEKCKQIIMKYTTISEEFLNKISDEDKDVFMFSDEAIKYGIIDEIF
jgi:ATP-dependent Clp protease protease subunit